MIPSADCLHASRFRKVLTREIQAGAKPAKARFAYVPVCYFSLKHERTMPVNLFDPSETNQRQRHYGLGQLLKPTPLVRGITLPVESMIVSRTFLRGCN